MTVTITSPVYGKQVGEPYTGPEEDWLLANGYAARAGYSGPGVSNTGPLGAAPDKDPLLAENREDPGDDYQFGKDTALAARVEAVSPNTGPAIGGTRVTLRGDNMVDVTGVTFGGTAGTALEVVDDNEVVVTAPAHAAGAVDVVVTDPSGSTTVAGGYTYTA